jgi:transcriptional regulator with XRE-family HTH domain
MLLENLKYYKEASKMTYEQIAEESKTPLSTIKNIFSGKNEPLASTLYRIATALNVSLEDLLADANVVLASSSIIEVQESLVEAQETIEVVKETANVMEAERDITKIENERLKVEIANLKTEMQLLKQELQHKDELLELHKFYRKLIPNN